MKFFVFLLLIHGLYSCDPGVSDQQDTIDIPEYRFGQEAPTLNVSIEADSPYAGIRLMLIEQQIRDSGFDRQSYFEYDDVQFRALSLVDDSDTTEAYEQWLIDHQPLIQSIMETSKLDEFFPDQGMIIYDKFIEGDPRREYVGGTREITNIMKADSARLWLEGESAAAIERMVSVVRLSLLSSKYANRSVLDALLGNAVAAVAVKHFEWMIRSGTASLNDREEITDSLKLIGGPDPVSLKQTYALNILSVHRWLGKQIEIEGGSDELWYAIGTIHASQVIVDQLFDIDIGGSVVSVDKEEAVRRVLQELDGITYEDIKRAHNTYEPLALEVGLMMQSENIDVDRLQQISDMTQDDETGITDLFMLSLADNVVRTSNRFVSQRDDLLQLLEE